MTDKEKAKEFAADIRLLEYKYGIYVKAENGNVKFIDRQGNVLWDLAQTRLRLNDRL